MTGTTIKQYSIQEQLGAGGMGVVYKALDAKLDREVALKFLPPHLNADPGAKARFIQEAKAASALDHANICTIHDVGEDEAGRLFIVMSFYDGDTLKYRLQQGALPLADAVDIGIQLARGLARAHEAGIVHRDIKPANIMVTRRGEVKILDFGVAKLSQSSDLTKAGSTVGTAAYMSPEQSKGETVDVRSDVWSAGVVLYEVLTGKQPFQGGYEAAMTYAIVNETPASPHELDPAIPEAISDIVMRCLAKNPADRFSDAAHVATRLDEFKSPSGTRASATTERVSETEDASGIPTAARISTLYAPVAAGTLAMVYAAMWILGLPDWVFPLGVGLMLLGLPILLLAANQERRKREGRDIGGPFAWLSWKLAVRGGFFSIGGLLILAIVLAVLRNMGVGPTASLQAAGSLQENAKIVVAEFENRTDEPGLSASISELLRIALSQSNVVDVMDGADVLSVLSRMNRSSSDKIDLDTAMEIAAREGAEAVLYGEISPIGSGFFVSAKLLAAHDGSELVALSQTARSDNDVIDAVDALSNALRERIGESIRSIRGNADLDRVTTSSLDALRLYTQGVAAEDAGDVNRAIVLLNQAIEKDSLFAMAHRKLAVTYNNFDIRQDLMVQAATRAYDLRDRLPERERFMAIAFYHTTVTIDYDRTIAAYESLLEVDPNNTAALNNVSNVYQRMGRWEEAERNLVQALQMGKRTVYYQNLWNVKMALKKYEEAWALIDDFETNLPGNPTIPALRFHTRIAEGQLQAAAEEIRISDRTTQQAWLAYERMLQGQWSLMTGRLAAAEREFAQMDQYHVASGLPEEAFESELLRLDWELQMTEDPERVRKQLDMLLERYPLDSLHVFDREYAPLALLYADLGDLQTAKRYMSRFESELPPHIQRSNGRRHLARAAILAGENRLPEAIALLRQSRIEEHCAVCFRDRESRYLAAIDSVDQAIREMETMQDWSWGFNAEIVGGTRAPNWLQLGELYSRSGQTQKAIDAYSNFVDMWSQADAELQPRVQYARSRIERLLEQSVREPQ
ncbi:MAG: protein kinase [Bacteroidetes bacterium]|nr:protein kinase [Bacteroidota bacterium]MDA0874255.1 protein kinase [Bacteroidota bacterium]